MTDNNAKTIPIPHNIVLEDRQHLTLSGVTAVDTFDEQAICVLTDLADLTVKGDDLHSNRLSLDMG